MIPLSRGSFPDFRQQSLGRRQHHIRDTQSTGLRTLHYTAGWLFRSR